MTDKPEQATRVFLPSLPDGWEWAATAENAETGEQVVVSYSPDGWEAEIALDGSLAFEGSSLRYVSYDSLRDALLDTAAHIKKVTAARARWEEAGRAYAEVVGVELDRHQPAALAATRRKPARPVEDTELSES